MQTSSNATSLNEFYSFLDHTENRGILPKATIHGRRAAAKAVFAVLEGGSEPSTVEYVTENFDTVLHRFTVKNRAEVKGQTLETYKSRLKGALQDYQQWIENPSAWERAISARGQKPKVAKKEVSSESKSEKSGAKAPAPEERAQYTGASHAKGGRVISLPIRGGQFELIATIPLDGLTMSEFKKFGTFLIHYLKDEEVKDQDLVWPSLLSDRTDDLDDRHEKN